MDKPWKEILNKLGSSDVSRVELIGEAGIGKTWMARQICEFATGSEGPFYIALWLNLNKEMDDMSLYESIASQLSLFLENDESDEEDDSDDEEDAQDAEEEKKNHELDELKKLIMKELNKLKFNVEDYKYLLLVLDDEGSVTKEEKVMKGLYLEDFLSQLKDNKPPKILITRRKEENEVIDGNKENGSCATDKPQSHSDEETESDSDGGIKCVADGEMKSVAVDESHVLAATKELPDPNTFHLSRETFKDVLKYLIKDGLLESLEEPCGKDSRFLKDCIVEMSLGLPAAVVLLAKSLNNILQKHPHCLSPKQVEFFKVAVLSSFSSVSTYSRGVTSRCNPILQLAYELLEPEDSMKSSIVDCFLHSLSFFKDCGCVNYQELIAHWILEGYFDPVRSVTKAYKDGHAILMKLMNRGFLKIQEDNVVMPEVAMKNIIDLRDRGLSGTSRIGLAKVIGSDMTKGLGKIKQLDDIIEGVRGTRKGEKVTTLLVSRNRLLRETPEKFFEKLKDIEILGLFQPTMVTFVSSLVKLEKLRVLVIRDCDLLDSIEELKILEGLHVLEVSGASSLKKISDDFFAAMPDLESLHLSGLQIESSPCSISLLKKLHCLIIKDCPLLKDLPDIQELVKLEVVDISGARGLQTCFDNTPGEKKDHSKNKNLKHLTKLQLLDFSESQIERLPIFQDSAVANKLHSLTRLILRDCSKLRRLSSLKPLSGLQILDLSGTTSLVKMLEVCFEDKKELRVLNLSGTNLSQLPSTIEELSNLSTLLLKDCPNLEVLPNIQKLENLEVIDVSGCTKLHKIEGSFEEMSYLRKVNLSGTKVMITQDFLPKESEINICCLKRFVRADGTPFEGNTWNDVKKAMMQQKDTSHKGSSSEEVVKSQEISESSEVRLNEPSSNDFPRGISKECFDQFPIYKVLNEKSVPFVVSESNPKVLEIHGSKGLGGPCDLDYEALAGAEYLSFVDCSSERLTSIINQTNSVKCCWIRMSRDIKDLFSDVEEERLGSLETLWITNLPSLDNISSGGSFKNLKNLSIDCCPNIVTLFPEVSQLPSSLEVLQIKHCVKLEKVFKEGVEAKLPNLGTFNKKNCPKFRAEMEDLRGSDSGCIEASPQD